jgi:hypothetical protein
MILLTKAILRKLPPLYSHVSSNVTLEWNGIYRRNNTRKITCYGSRKAPWAYPHLA